MDHHASTSPLKAGRFLLFAWCLLLGCWMAAAPSNSPLAARMPDRVTRHCGDFLAQMHLKPRGVHYVACRYLPDRQGKPLQATYYVHGPFAARAERSFVRAIGMPSLRLSCCQWDAPEHWFRGTDGREYGITMVSDETVYGSRAGWPSIPLFEIVVETFTEEI